MLPGGDFTIQKVKVNFKKLNLKKVKVNIYIY